ncbi:MAG: hypothetical protein IPK59_19480 [Rhodospirillaceae bacterium]|nr:hypothetical protein [Rhodospirillaceae bacterium]
MAWYVEDFSEWERRYSPQFNVVPSTNWFKGQDLESGAFVEGYSDQVLRAVQVSSHKVLPDFFRVGILPVCSDTFRSIVEILEPNVHQFFPIEFEGNGSGTSDPKCFVFNALNALDAVVVEKSSVYLHEWEAMSGSGKMTRYSRVAIKSPRGLVLKKDLVQGKHMWRTSNVLPRLLFFSNELMRAVEAARLERLTVFPAAEE